MPKSWISRLENTGSGVYPILRYLIFGYVPSRGHAECGKSFHIAYSLLSVCIELYLLSELKNDIYGIRGFFYFNIKMEFYISVNCHACRYFFRETNAGVDKSVT